MGYEQAVGQDWTACDGAKILDLLRSDVEDLFKAAAIPPVKLARLEKLLQEQSDATCKMKMKNSKSYLMGGHRILVLEAGFAGHLLTVRHNEFGFNHRVSDVPLGW